MEHAHGALSEDSVKLLTGYIKIVVYIFHRS